jgi:hypothetical protein
VRWRRPASTRCPVSFSISSTRGAAVSYKNVQFTKAPNVLRGMGLSHLPKNQKAIEELSGKGMAPK